MYVNAFGFFFRSLVISTVREIHTNRPKTNDYYKFASSPNVIYFPPREDIPKVFIPIYMYVYSRISFHFTL